MASYVAKLATKKYGKKYASEGLGPTVNPEAVYYEQVPAKRLGINTTKKVKRPPPPGLTDEEKDILKQVKRRAYMLDMSLCNCCGIRFGWSAVIGIVPAIGDVLDLMMAYLVVKLCLKANIPATIQTRMYTNLMIDFAIGLVPILGDLADGVYKANTRNAALLEDVLRKRGDDRNKTARLAAEQTPHPPGSRLANDHNGMSGESYLNDQHGGPPPRYTSTRAPRQPEATYASHESRHGQGYFGGRQDPDLENGESMPPQQPPRTKRSQRERRG